MSRALPKSMPSVLAGSLRRRLHGTCPTAKPDIRICFIGDSFTNGAGDDTALGFPGRLCSDLRNRCNVDATVYNLGVRRDTTSDILARWEQEVNARLKENEHAGRLVFSFGTNDNVFEHGQRRVHRDLTMANARSILTKAKSLWPTIMLGPPWTSVDDVDDGNGSLSSSLEILCQELGVPFLALFDNLDGNEAWAREAREGGGIHPSASGYTLISNAVMDWDAWEQFVRQGQSRHRHRLLSPP